MNLHGTAAANAAGGGKKTDAPRQAKDGAPGNSGGSGAHDEKSTKEAAAARKLREQLDKLKPQVLAVAQTTLQKSCTETYHFLCTDTTLSVLLFGNKRRTKDVNLRYLLLEEVIRGRNLGYLSASCFPRPLSIMSQPAFPMLCKLPSHEARRSCLSRLTLH